MIYTRKNINSNCIIKPLGQLECSIKFDTVKSEKTILYMKGSHVIDSKLYCISFSETNMSDTLSLSYGVHISQLICFARVCSNVDDFNNRNLFLTAKL